MPRIAGVAIADAPPMKTLHLQAGIAAFIAPYLHLRPALPLMGDWATILQAVFTAARRQPPASSMQDGCSPNSPAERVDVRGRDRARVPRPHRPHRLRHGQPRLFHPDRTQEAALRRPICPSFRALARNLHRPRAHTQRSPSCPPAQGHNAFRRLRHRPHAASPPPAAAEDAKPINFRAACARRHMECHSPGSASWSTTAIPAALPTCCRALRSATLRLEQRRRRHPDPDLQHRGSPRRQGPVQEAPQKCGFARQHERHFAPVHHRLRRSSGEHVRRTHGKETARPPRSRGQGHPAQRGRRHAAGRIRVHLRRHHEMGRRTHRRFRQRPRGYVPGRHPERLPDPRPRPAVPHSGTRAQRQGEVAPYPTGKSVTAKTGQSIGVIPADFYGGAVGRDIPCITDSTVMLVRKNMPDADVYKITKAIVEGFEELHAVQPTWKTLVPEHMADNLALPLHPGAEKYITVRPASSNSPRRSPFPARCSHGSGIPSRINENPAHIRTRLIGKRFRKHPATLPCPAAFRRAYHRKRTTSWSSISVSALRTKAS
ncbi:MAG: TAXI family TRAP transporter solute-binding subunit [Bilophila wadsworthia]